MHNGEKYGNNWPPHRGEGFPSPLDHLRIGTDRPRRWARNHKRLMLLGAGATLLYVIPNVFFDTHDVPNYTPSEDVFHGHPDLELDDIVRSLCPDEDPQDVKEWLKAYNSNMDELISSPSGSFELVIPICPERPQS